MDENLEEQLTAGPQPGDPLLERFEELPPEQFEEFPLEQFEELPPEQPEEPQPPEKALVKRDPSSGLDLYLNVRILVSMMAAFVLLFTFVARIIVVSGESMEDTLIEGDLILVWSLGYTPRQGDIVVLTQESYQKDSIVKRVIATGGQTVEINYNTSTVKVDGVPLEEDYTKEELMMVPYYEGTTEVNEGIAEVTVPEGSIFVMGDNRNHSADSRYKRIGIVDTRCVIGRGLSVIFPFSHWKGL